MTLGYDLHLITSFPIWYLMGHKHKFALPIFAATLSNSDNGLVYIN